jgi:hypothetical protein
VDSRQDVLVIELAGQPRDTCGQVRLLLGYLASQAIDGLDVAQDGGMFQSG